MIMIKFFVFVFGVLIGFLVGLIGVSIAIHDDESKDSEFDNRRLIRSTKKATLQCVYNNFIVKWTTDVPVDEPFFSINDVKTILKSLGAEI